MLAYMQQQAKLCCMIGKAMPVSRDDNAFAPLQYISLYNTDGIVCSKTALCCQFHPQVQAGLLRASM